MPWSANAKYLDNHWSMNKNQEKDFISRLVTEGNTGGRAFCSQWSAMRLLSAAGELVAVGDLLDVAGLLWSAQDAVVFMLVGGWLRGASCVQVVPEGGKNKKSCNY